MRFGVCIRADQFLQDPIRTDYVELAAWDLYKLTESEFAEVRAAVAEGKIVTYSSNGLVAPDMRMTGPDADLGRLRDYCESTFERLAQLKISMLVFGSSKAKNVPEGFPYEKAWEQLYEVGTIMSDIAAKHGQTVVVEPLSYGEVNIINTVDEAAEYAKNVNRDNFKALADFYHFHHNHESFDEIRRNKDNLKHFHIAAPGTRNMPETDGQWAYCEQCLRVLHEIGYDGAVSFEGGRQLGNAAVSDMLDRMRGFYASL